MNGATEEDVQRQSVELVFDQFVTACTCKSILSTFHQLLDVTGLRHADHAQFYNHLKAKLKGSWKAQALWTKIDKRASHKDYKRQQACKDIKVLIIGAGPCGLRTAIECALLGAKTVIVEKRDRFSRNNVLHLWPYLITDLRNLGAKKFFGKFCAGAIDHISIRQLQCILMKVALLLGVEVHVNVSFDGLLEPPDDQTTGIGWRCKITPADHALSEYVFDVLIGADGKRNTLTGFTRKEFRGKLAIAITANFINRNTQVEAAVEEISGVAFIFNQKFFLDLRAQTRIDLENIVYYKDDTHYFVMTAKKASLLDKGVLKEDYSDTQALLDRKNVDQEALMSYAKEAANFSTGYQLPNLEYAVNNYGQADVSMFDFTSMFAAENASRFVLKNGHHLLMGLVGDSLLEPFWPTGSGCARGFLSAFDAAWMIRSWALGKSPPQVLAERESVYTVLSQTTPNYLHKNFNQYSIDPNSRYPNLNNKYVKPHQVGHLYEGGVVEMEEEEAPVPIKRPRNGEDSNSDDQTDCLSVVDCKVKGHVTSLIYRYQFSPPYEGPNRESKDIRQRYINNSIAHGYNLDKNSDDKDANMNKENHRMEATDGKSSKTGMNKKRRQNELIHGDITLLVPDISVDSATREDANQRHSSEESEIDTWHEESETSYFTNILKTVPQNELIHGDITLLVPDISESGSSVDSATREDANQRHSSEEREIETWHEEIETSYFTDILNTVARFVVYVLVLSIEPVIRILKEKF